MCLAPFGTALKRESREDLSLLVHFVRHIVTTVAIGRPGIARSGRRSRRHKGNEKVKRSEACIWAKAFRSKKTTAQDVTTCDTRRFAYLPRWRTP